MNIRFGKKIAVYILFAAGLIEAHANDIKAGRAGYIRFGCYECHGYVGQGGLMSGPKLAPSPVPLTAMIAYVRAPRGVMPLYSARIVSDQELGDIHAYLSSIAPPPAVENIPLLMISATSKSATTATPRPSPTVNNSAGAAVYAVQCAACHGAKGQGASGPALLGGRLDSEQVAAVVRNPGGVMPRLFPGVLSQSDVTAVAKYVNALK